MLAAVRIVFDVLVFRLRKLEMANLFAAVAIMLALRLEWADVAVRTSYGLVLNLLAYLTNDYYDVHRDLAAERAVPKTRFLVAHLRAALGAQLGLAALLVAIALAWRPELLVAGALGATLCWAYSAKLKRVPYADVAAMTAWGVVMPLVAVPFESALAWALVLQLALFSSVFESIQVVRDHDIDVAAGIETTAVRLGARATAGLVRFFMVASAAYAVLVLHRWIGLLMLVAPLLPIKAGDEERYWTRVRLVLGVAWLGILGAVYWQGASDGLLLQVK